MKRIAYTIAIAFALSACGGGEAEVLPTDIVSNPATAKDSESKEGLPAMEFETDLKEFGTIVQGEKARMTFAFTNTGESQLIISSATGSCGCTVPDYPKTPIAPGESAEIEVLFNSEGKIGKQHKKIYIVANTNPSQNTVAISGNVVGPENNTAE